MSESKKDGSEILEDLYGKVALNLTEEEREQSKQGGFEREWIEPTGGTFELINFSCPDHKPCKIVTPVNAYLKKCEYLDCNENCRRMRPEEPRDD